MDRSLELPGIDVAAGLRFSGGKFEHYQWLLRRFRDSQSRRFVADFRAAREAGDGVGSQRLAHTLKGLALTIGAKTLGTLAGRLENAALEANASATVLESDIANETKRLMPGLVELGEGEQSNAAAAHAYLPALKEMIDRVRVLLEARDTAAVALLEEFGGVLGRAGVHPWYLSEIDSAVRRNDYDHALRILALASESRAL